MPILRTHYKKIQHPNFTRALNLCTENVLPLGTKQLLELNLNFWLAFANLKDNINKTTQKWPVPQG
jgi:hypothetical protein